MIKKISVDQLRPGMYVSDLNCGWLDHPFVSKQVAVSNREVLRKIVSTGIRELYIDTTRGLDVPDAPTREEVRREIDRDLDRMAQEAPKPIVHVVYEKEIERAQAVKSDAETFARNLLEDVRLGRQIEVEHAEHAVEQMIDSVFRNQDALLSLLHVRQADEYTYAHSVSVCVLLLAFARALKFDRSIIQQIGVGALLHDVGKMKTPLEVLNKPGRLTDEEFAEMRRHVELGEEILSRQSGIPEIGRRVAAEHHERFDGSGYPRGLKGDEISVFGQMAAIVDVYDAITSDRIYHKGMTPTEALRKIFEWSKFHFNVDLVHNFIHCVGIYPSGTLVRLDSGRLAVVLEQTPGKSLMPRVMVVFDTRTQRPLTPQLIDLSQSGERIVDSAPQQQWQIDPSQFFAK